jgi:peptidoglycan/LPS O-acetylase OafA/YrhL
MEAPTTDEKLSARRESPLRISASWLPRKLSTSASASLDILRAVAACAVMVGHLRTLFFVDFQHLGSRSLPLTALYFLTGFGHQSVMVFFVLSGFLISSTIIRSHVLGDWAWRDYAINRATRLYVVLIPGLLLGFFWDRLGSWQFAAKGLYIHPVQGLGTAVPLQNLTVGTFFGNLFFLQTILCATFGSNGPLWSLANEFWYYVLFPVALGAGLAWAARRVRLAIPLTIFAILLGFFLGADKLVGFLIWLAGCALLLFYSRLRMLSRLPALATLFLFSGLLVAVLYASRTVWKDPALSDLAVGFAFTFFLFAVLQSAPGEASPGYSAIAREFAGFSYSLYVLHFPLLLFLRAWLVPSERWQPTPAHLLLAALVGIACLLFAWSVSLVTERKTSAARKWVKRLVA